MFITTTPSCWRYVSLATCKAQGWMEFYTLISIPFPCLMLDLQNLPWEENLWTRGWSNR